MTSSWWNKVIFGSDCSEPSHYQNQRWWPIKPTTRNRLQRIYDIETNEITLIVLIICNLSPFCTGIGVNVHLLILQKYRIAPPWIEIITSSSWVELLNQWFPRSSNGPPDVIFSVFFPAKLSNHFSADCIWHLYLTGLRWLSGGYTFQEW